MRSRASSIVLAAGRRVASSLAALPLAAMLAACAALSPPPQESPALHLLQAPAVTLQAERRIDLVIEVAPPRASPGFDTPRIAYVERPFALEYYSRSEWADEPARMLGPLLARALDASGGFRAVVQGPTTVHADLRVETELVRLQQDFTGKSSRADLAMRIQVVDAKARRVVATLAIEESEPARSEDAYGGVAAMNVALGRALGRAVTFVVSESFGARGYAPTAGDGWSPLDRRDPASSLCAVQVVPRAGVVATDIATRRTQYAIDRDRSTFRRRELANVVFRPGFHGLAGTRGSHARAVPILDALGVAR
jgi:cholesterol transport system auxiliary component